MLHRLRRLSIALGATALLAAGPLAAEAHAQAPAAPVLRIAVVDSRRVITETEEGLRMQASLRKISDEKQAALVSKQRQLKQEAEDLTKEEKQKGRSPALEGRMRDLQARAMELEQKAYTLQTELARKEQELVGPMMQKTTAIVRAIAAREGFDVVVEKQAVAFFRVDLDLTEKVIQQYNAGDPGAGKDAPKDEKKPAKDDKKPAKDDKKPAGK